MEDIEANRWRRLRPLLDRGVELCGEARRAFLDGLRGDEAELKDAVEQLLARHDDLHDLTLSTAVALVVLGISQDDAGSSKTIERPDPVGQGSAR